MIFIPWHVSFSTEIFSLDGPKIQQLNFNTMKHDLNIYYIMQKNIMISYKLRKYNFNH